MFTFPPEYIVYINIVLVLWLLIDLYLGYKNGFLMQLVSIIRSIAAIFIAWLLSPVFASLYGFFGTIGTGVIMIERSILAYANRIIWTVILYLAIQLLLMLVTPIVKIISRVPFVKQVNSIFGGIMSILIFGVKLLILFFILTTPLIKNGNDIIEATLLKPVAAVSQPLFKEFDTLLSRNIALQHILIKQRLSPDQEEAMSQWLTEQGFSQSEIQRFFNKYEQ